MIGGAGVDVNVVELESYLATAFTPESTFAMSDDTHTHTHTLGIMLFAGAFTLQSMLHYDELATHLMVHLRTC